jgi:hypothetical protein
MWLNIGMGIGIQLGGIFNILRRQEEREKNKGPARSKKRLSLSCLSVPSPSRTSAMKTALYFAADTCKTGRRRSPRLSRFFLSSRQQAFRF